MDQAFISSMKAHLKEFNMISTADIAIFTKNKEEGKTY